MAHDTHTTFEALLRQKGRVRALARTLVRDAAAADDLVQEAVLAALRRPAAVAGDGRGLVARLLQNLARDGARGDGRRARREHETARAEALPDVTHAVLAAERQRELVDAVLALDEPYRSVVLLRWFEDLPPRAIAERTGRGIEAVKKQLQRGLVLLRTKLEERFGPEGAWAVAFLPLVGRDALPGVALPQISVAKLSSVAAGVVAVGALTWTLTSQSGRAPEVALAPANLELRPEAPLTTPEAVRERVATSEPSEASPHTHDHSSAATAQAPTEPRRYDPPFRGCFIDLAGERITGDDATALTLVATFDGALASMYGDEPHRLAADASGEIVSDRLPVSALYGSSQVLEVEGGPFAVLAVVQPDNGVTPLVLAPSSSLAGVVVDSTGGAIPDARVEWRADLRSIASFPRDLATTWRGWNTSTDGGGRFALPRVPFHARFQLEVTADGFHPHTSHTSGRDDDVLRIELVRDDTSAMHVGIVVDGVGAPVAGAEVMLATRVVTTDDDGRFRIEAERPGARLAGDRPSPLVARVADGRFTLSPVVDGQLGPHTLTLPDTMRSIRGRLLDEHGRPMSFVTVSVFDGTQTNSARPLEGQPPSSTSDDGRTDQFGNFALEHLLDRPYTLRFLDREPFLVLDVPNVPAGTQDLEVRVPADLRMPLVEGRAVDLFGRPLPGIEVCLGAYQTGGHMRMGFTGLATSTDEEGRFRLPNVPRRGATIAFDPRPDDGLGGPHFQIEALPLGSVGDITVPLDCDVVARLAEGPIGASVRFVDQDGRSLTLREVEPGGIAFRQRMKQHADGSFGRLLVPQAARTVLVLDADGSLLRRVPLELEALGRNELVW